MLQCMICSAPGKFKSIFVLATALQLRRLHIDLCIRKGWSRSLDSRTILRTPYPVADEIDHSKYDHFFVVRSRVEFMLGQKATIRPSSFGYNPLDNIERIFF